MPIKPKSLLWVDDESELLESHRIFLRSKGYEVEWATNADDAVELLRRRPFDLMLLDEQMPGTRGLDAYRDVREIAPNLPVVMVTKSEDDATLREAIGVNVRDPESLVKTLGIRPEYLKTQGRDGIINYSEWSPQLGRRFRALKL